MTYEERCTVMRAIIRIHHECDYFGGMNMLCKLIGWPSLLNEFYSDEEKVETIVQFARWVRHMKREIMAAQRRQTGGQNATDS